jgi:hypothetical protein
VLGNELPHRLTAISGVRRAYEAKEHHGQKH